MEDCYNRLLDAEEAYRKAEQTALLESVLAGGRGRLSQLRKAGLAMTNLEVANKRSASGGRLILDLTDRSKPAGDGREVKCNAKGSKGSKDSRGRGPEKQSDSADSPSSDVIPFKPGDLVNLVADGKILCDSYGVIERRGKNSDSADISVSLRKSEDSESSNDTAIDEFPARLALVKVLNDSGGFDKMRRALKVFFHELDGSGLVSLTRKVIEGFKGVVAEKKVGEGATENAVGNNDVLPDLAVDLNLEQRAAVYGCLKADRVALIHGPPGTGKTQTLVALISKLLSSSAGKLLVCGPSNISVDNICERLLALHPDLGETMIRLGHPARVLPQCHCTTLDAWMDCSDEGKLLKEVRDEIDALVKLQLPRAKTTSERSELRGELRELRRERRGRERNLSKNLISRAKIILCTLSTAAGRHLSSENKFAWTIIDEAGQSLLPECLSVLGKTEKLILAGDHCQLPPTVMNPALKDLEVSLFEMFIPRGQGTGKAFPPGHDAQPATDYPIYMLKEQYRMNESIMAWSNCKFYFNQLRANPMVSGWKLEPKAETEESELEHLNELIFYDTAGWDLRESTPSTTRSSCGLERDQSRMNVGEGQIVLQHCRRLLNLTEEAVFSGDCVGLLSPYAAQVSHLRELLMREREDVDLAPLERSFFASIECGSVDGFQGREKDVIIVSLVRSNEPSAAAYSEEAGSTSSVGFLAELRRLNVAVTRARKQLVIIGDSETLSRNGELRQFVEFLNEAATIQCPEIT